VREKLSDLNMRVTAALRTAALDLTALHIYDGSFCSSLNVTEIADYLCQVLPSTSVQVHEEFLQFFIIRDQGDVPRKDIEALARELVSIKVIDPRQRNRTAVPLTGEVGYEKRRLLNTARQPTGILYDGERLQELFNQVLPENSRGSHTLHLVLTNQLFGTWSLDDLRFHARTSIYGIPSIISTAGLVEAPAKSRQYYLARQMGVSPEVLEQKFKEQFLVHDDSRLTGVIKGYCMQALFYSLTGDPFCDDPNCRLYNAHWQHELIRAQLAAPYEFCPRHLKIIEALRQKA
jgi:hypothetical protein